MDTSISNINTASLTSARVDGAGPAQSTSSAFSNMDWFSEQSLSSAHTISADTFLSDSGQTSIDETVALIRSNLFS